MRVIALASLILLACGNANELQAAGSVPNRLVILLDGSGSFERRREAALRKSEALLDSMAATRLHRWEPANDSIFVVSVDALPDVLWKGTLRDLKSMDRSGWTKRFRARSDYACCTDIGAGFRLAADLLATHTKPVHKYVVVFSDLVNEPPVSSLCDCKPVSGPVPPPADFPWDQFRDVSTSILWVPAEQKFVWHRDVAQHELASNFALYTTSESEAVSLAPPPRVRAQTSAAERAAVRDRVKSNVLRIGLAIVGLVIVAAAGTLGALMLARRRGRARRGQV